MKRFIKKQTKKGIKAPWKLNCFWRILLCKSAFHDCNIILEIINFQGSSCLGSQVWRFQSMEVWFHHFWACGEKIHDGAVHMAEQTLSLLFGMWKRESGRERDCGSPTPSQAHWPFKVFILSRQCHAENQAFNARTLGDIYTKHELPKRKRLITGGRVVSRKKWDAVNNTGC